MMIPSRKRQNQKGIMTLAELLIAAALSLIVTTALYTMYVGVLNVSARLDGEKSILHSTRTVFNHLKLDLSQADLNKTTLIGASTGEYLESQTDLTALAVPIAAGQNSGGFITDDSTGEPVWQGVRIYYIKANTTDLRIKTVYPRNFKAPISEADLRRYCSEEGGRVLVGGVSAVNFKLVAEDNNAKKMDELQVYLTLAFNDRHGRPGFYRAQMTYVGGNSRYENSGTSHTPVPTPSPPSDPPVVPEDFSS